MLWVFQIFNQDIEGMHAHPNNEINQMQHLQKSLTGKTDEEVLSAHCQKCPEKQLNLIRI